LPPSPLTLAATEALRNLAAKEPDNGNLTAALRILAKWRAELVANTIVARSGTTVQSGPFAGMNYGLRAAEGSGSARLLGVYEASLAPVIEQIIARAYPLVVDIGCAEGYYAVGLARRMPASRIMARDASPKAQDLCRRLAQMNGVQDRVEVGGLMDHASLAICAAQRTLILCDIEGAEAELLDPVAAPALTQADILVECHDVMRPGLTALLADRFGASHHVTRMDRQIAARLPDWMEELSDLDRLIALWEWRGGPTPWLWMQAK
jgi:predicted O-methyltransferase YrrM